MEDRLIHPLPPISPLSIYPRIDPKRNATDNTGCPMLCPSPPTRHPEQNETWFALVRRGDCDFVTKAREVQRLGAKALIVGSRDESLLSMSAKGRYIALLHPCTHYNTENFVWPVLLIYFIYFRATSVVDPRRRLIRHLHSCGIHHEKRLPQYH